MFFLQWKSKAVDDRSQDFQQFSDSIESLSLIRELEEDVVDRSANVGSQVQELSVNTMQGCLEEVTLTRVFRVEQLQQLRRISCKVLRLIIEQKSTKIAYLKHKVMIDILLRNVGVEVLALDKAQEEFINNLDMGPCDFQHRLILLWVKRLALGSHRGRDWSEKILCEHLDYPRIHGFRDDRTVVGDVV